VCSMEFIPSIQIENCVLVMEMRREKKDQSYCVEGSPEALCSISSPFMVGCLGKVSCCRWRLGLFCLLRSIYEYEGLRGRILEGNCVEGRGEQRIGSLSSVKNSCGVVSTELRLLTQTAA
jgi:hypothetical protein